MKVWAIADLHLSFGVPGKEMDVFGPRWFFHTKRLKEQWERKVAKEDLVLLAGDISWALHLPEVVPDLEWLDTLPGTKVMIKGNHDFWWHSAKKVRAILPPSLSIVHNDAVTFGEVTIGGSRLWEHPEVRFEQYIEFRPPPQGVHVHPHEETEQIRIQEEKIYLKEIERMHLSLKQLDPKAKWRIAMLHYPPTGPMHEENVITRICDQYQIDYCIYGHLHNLRQDSPVNFTLHNTKYVCVVGDFINFDPFYLFSSPVCSPTSL